MIGNAFSFFKKLVLPLRNKLRKFVVYETTKGVKYQFGRFNSDRFNEYFQEEYSFLSTGLTFSNLLFPPDLLRNSYTQCGISLTSSAHFRLMEEIENRSINSTSEYIMRCSLGTLDARLPFNPGVNKLIQRYQDQKELILGNSIVRISAILINSVKNPSYIILDGKHRAAQLAFFDKPELLRIQLISKEFANSSFFRKVYSYVLALDPSEYSINQKIIKEILDE